MLRRYLVGASARFGKSAAVALAETGKIGGPRERGSRRARARDDTLRRGRRDASVNAGERRARAGVAPRSRPARSSLRRLAGEKKTLRGEATRGGQRSARSPLGKKADEKKFHRTYAHADGPTAHTEKAGLALAG